MSAIDNPILIQFRDQWSQVAGTLPAAARIFLDALEANAYSTDAQITAARSTLTLIASITDTGDGACRYDTLTWDEMGGVDGPVLICDTHRWPGQGEVYQGDPAHPAGICQMFTRPRVTYLHNLHRKDTRS